MENSQPVHKKLHIYFVVLKNIHSFAESFVNGKQNFYTFTHLQLI